MGMSWCLSPASAIATLRPRMSTVRMVIGSPLSGPFRKPRSGCPESLARWIPGSPALHAPRNDGAYSPRHLRRARGEFACEQPGRLGLQPWRHFARKHLHALARERVRHVAEVKLDQQHADFGVFEDFHD